MKQVVPTLRFSCVYGLHDQQTSLSWCQLLLIEQHTVGLSM